MKTKEWYHKDPYYPFALRLAKKLIRDKHVDGDWEPDALSSWLVKPIRASLPIKLAPRPAGKRRK